MPAPKIKAVDGIYDLRRTFGAAIKDGFFKHFVEGGVHRGYSPEGHYVSVKSTWGVITSIRYKNERDANRLLGAVIDEVRRENRDLSAPAVVTPAD